jgi:hypothetical protein
MWETFPAVSQYGTLGFLQQAAIQAGKMLDSEFLELPTQRRNED